MLAERPRPSATWTGSTRSRAWPCPFLATAFGTFLIRQGFLGIPADLRDATRLDGLRPPGLPAGKFAVPLTRPVIASFTVISFLGAWNQYLWPRAVITDTGQLGHDADRAARPHANTPETQQHRRRRAPLIAAVPIVILLIFFSAPDRAGPRPPARSRAER